MTSHDPIPGSLVDAVFRKLLRQELSSELVELLAAAGVDVTVPAAHAYPRAVWYRAIELTATAFFPGDSPPDQLRLLGRRVIDVLERRGVKGPWLSVVRLMGPRRALLQAAGFAEKYSPVKLEVHETGKRAVEVRVDEGEQAEFLAGLIEGFIGLLGGRDAQVRVGPAAPGRGVFAASWR